MKNYKCYISANKYTPAFDSTTGRTEKSAMASAKRKYNKNKKDLYFWCVYVHPGGQEEKL